MSDTNDKNLQCRRCQAMVTFAESTYDDAWETLCKTCKSAVLNNRADILRRMSPEDRAYDAWVTNPMRGYEEGDTDGE